MRAIRHVDSLETIRQQVRTPSGGHYGDTSYIEAMVASIRNDPAVDLDPESIPSPFSLPSTTTSSNEDRQARRLEKSAELTSSIAAPDDHVELVDGGFNVISPTGVTHIVHFGDERDDDSPPELDSRRPSITEQSTTDVSETSTPGNGWEEEELTLRFGQTHIVDAGDTPATEQDRPEDRRRE